MNKRIDYNTPHLPERDPAMADISEIIQRRKEVVEQGAYNIARAPEIARVIMADAALKEQAEKQSTNLKLQAVSVEQITAEQATVIDSQDQFLSDDASSQDAYLSALQEGEEGNDATVYSLEDARSQRELYARELEAQARESEVDNTPIQPGEDSAEDMRKIA